jgi:hypothetical protein
MRPPNKRMQLTKLRAAPVRQAEVPPCAPAGRMDGGTASQLIRGVGRTIWRMGEVRLIAITIAIVVCLIAPAGAQGRPCSREQAMQALATASALGTWPEILASFRTFGHCDDGAIAEGYSVSIIGMLADRWGQVAELDKALSAEPTFGAFVLRHINETAGRDDFSRLVANAAVRCPPESAATCGAILSRARELQRELQRQR